MRVMGSRIAPRLLAATLLIAVAALIVLLLGGRLDLALIALVGGVAAALIAIGVREERDGPAPAPTSDADTLVRELLDAIVEPVMLVRGGIVTFANAETVALASDLVPLDRIMVETDAPFLTPEPHRTTRPNEPRFVGHVAAFLASRRGLDPREFESILDANAERFFGITLPV